MTIILNNTRSLPVIIGMDKDEAKKSLEENGYAVVMYPAPVDQAEKTNIVMDYRESGDTVIVNYGAMLPDLTGMDRGKAIVLLTASKFTVDSRQDFSDTYPAGQVMAWEYSGNGAVQLLVSKGPGVITCPTYHIEYDDTLDSGEDSLKATIRLNRANKCIETLFSLTVNSPHKYTYPRFAYVSVDGSQKSSVMLRTPDTDLPKGKPSRFELDIPYDQPNFPAVISIDLEMIIDDNETDKVNYELRPQWKE